MLRLIKPPPGFILSGGTVPAGQSVVRATLTVPAEAQDDPYSLSLEGRAAIHGRGVTRQAVPADDMMQAFIYRHLVPARDLQVAVIGTPRKFTISVLSPDLVRIPVGETVRVPVKVPSRSSFGTVQLELSDPPEGITIEKVSLGRSEGEIVLRSDAAVVKAGLQGNLIVNAFAAKAGRGAGKGKEQRKKRRILLSVLPAIPFEVVPD